MKEHHKVRSGCVVCKTRRVKCDEGKPNCLRCRKAGRKCEYQVPKTWLFGKGSSLPGDVSDDLDIQSRLKIGDHDEVMLLHNLDSDPPGTPEERQLLYMYRNASGSPEVALDTDIELLIRYVPQLGHTIPALRSAMIATAAYLQGMVSPRDISRKYNELAHTSYVKTLQQLVSPEARKDLRPEHVVVVCIMLRCIDAFRHDHNSANLHLGGAVRIVAELEPGDTKHLEPGIRSLIARLARKSAVATGASNGAHISASSLDFRTPGAALEDLSNRVLQICQSLAAVPESLTHDYSSESRSVIQQQCRQLDDWHLKLKDSQVLYHLEARNTSILYAYIQYQVIRIVLMNLAKPPGQRYKDDTGGFGAILKLAQQFAEANDRDPDGGKAYLNGHCVRLGFGLELLPALFFIITECLDDGLRQQAIDWLKQDFRRELGWESFHSAQVGEWLMEKEQTRSRSESTSHSNDMLSVESPSRKTDSIQILSIEFYRSMEVTGDAFRRPEWALLHYEQDSELSAEWLCLEEQPSETGWRGTTQSDCRFCYRLDEPFAPSLAAMVTLAWRDGHVGPVASIKSEPWLAGMNSLLKDSRQLSV